MRDLKKLRISGCISLSALQKFFWTLEEGGGVNGVNKWVAPLESDTLPKPGFQLLREAVSIDLSVKIAVSGNIYAKRFCALLLLIQNRIEVTIASSKEVALYDMPGNTLPHLPPEMWTIIAHFNYRHYFPKLDITTTQRGLDELEPHYEKHDLARTSYNSDMIKLQQDWSTPVRHMK